MEKTEYLISRGYIPVRNKLKLAKELFRKDQERLNKK